MAKRKSKRKLAPRPKQRPIRTKWDDITELGDTELISDIYESPYMRRNPFAKLGLYGLLEDGELKSRGRKPLPIKTTYDDRVWTVINRRNGKPRQKVILGHYMLPEFVSFTPKPEQDILVSYDKEGNIEPLFPDEILINTVPNFQKSEAKSIDKIKRKPSRPTSSRDAVIDTIIHELIHRGFSTTPALPDVPEKGQHQYIAEKHDAAYSPVEASTYYRKRFEKDLQEDKQTAKFIRDKMPSLYAGPYKYEEHIEPPGIMTRLWKALLK